MRNFNKPKYILMDIEGTIASISFVHQVLFPYSRKNLPHFLQEYKNEPQIKKIIDEIVEEGIEREKVLSTLISWVEQDKKDGRLKIIQGKQWKLGFENKEFKGHLYPEVKDQWEVWSKMGIGLGIYSSGSVEAQKLLLGYSEFGDVRGYIQNYFDTGVGNKRDKLSYLKISHELNIPGEEIIFLSDIGEELDAASEASMKVCQLKRVDNDKFLPSKYDQIESLDQLKFI